MVNGDVYNYKLVAAGLNQKLALAKIQGFLVRVHSYLHGAQTLFDFAFTQGYGS